jgi:hypothetical protein
MQRFLKWLGNLLFAEKGAPEKPDLRATNARLRVAPARRRAAAVREAKAVQPRRRETAGIDPDTELGSRILDGGPGKNILAHTTFIREDTGTHETLKIVDTDLVDAGEESGFDPYNTGRYDRSANWAKRTRE